MTKLLLSILLLPLAAAAAPQPPAPLADRLPQARMVPDLMNGQVVGYRILQILAGSPWDKIGIKDNDVILRADGEAVVNAAIAFETLGRIAHGSADRHILVLRRNGEVVTKVIEGTSQVKQ